KGDDRMRFIVAGLVGLAWLSSIIAAPALADVKPIAVGQGEAFGHQPSGIVVDATAAGIPRASVGQYDDKQLDIIVDFRTPDQSEITTIYLFRNVSGDVPLWFDRIQRTVEATDKFGNLTITIPPAAFVPAGQSNARGL